MSDENEIVSAIRQFGNHIVLLGLRDPVGPFVDRSFNVSGVRDIGGRIMLDDSGRIMVADPDIGTGGKLSGAVLKAGGEPVPGAEVSYIQLVEQNGLLRETVISRKAPDDQGRYGFDFILKQVIGGVDRNFKVIAEDPETGQSASLQAQVRGNGQRMTLDLVLTGQGTVRGVVRDANGGVLKDMIVTATSLTDGRRLSAVTDDVGAYLIEGLPVGAFGLRRAARRGRCGCPG